MNTGNCIEIINPYEWLPSYGENRVELRTESLSLIITVEYEEENLTRKKKELLFSGTCAFYRASFPGPYLLNIAHNDKGATHLGSLVQYLESDAALAWTRHFGDGRIVKHYRVAFLSENVLLEIFANDVQLREPII